jgi:hypothetical protein
MTRKEKHLQSVVHKPSAYKTLIIANVNRKNWWHVPSRDPDACEKRGVFLASSFREAEFGGGRPLDRLKRVSVVNPFLGDEEEESSHVSRLRFHRLNGSAIFQCPKENRHNSAQFGA